MANETEEKFQSQIEEYAAKFNFAIVSNKMDPQVAIVTMLHIRMSRQRQRKSGSPPGGRKKRTKMANETEEKFQSQIEEYAAKFNFAIVSNKMDPQVAIVTMLHMAGATLAQNSPDEAHLKAALNHAFAAMKKTAEDIFSAKS